jgi:hypothetical protein
MTVMKPRLGVVYDQGAAGPAEIVRSLSEFTDVVLLIPDSEHTRRIASLLNALPCKVRPIALHAPSIGLPALDGITTFSQRCLLATAEVAEALRLPGHSAETATALTDKMRQRQVLQAVDPVLSLSIQSVDELARAVEQVGLPAVIKPARGEGSAFTTRVDTLTGAVRAAMLAWEAAPGRRLLLETFLGGYPPGPVGDYVSVEMASIAGMHHIIAVTGKFPLAMPFRERGNFWPAQLPESGRRDVESLATQAMAALGVTSGLAHIEIKLTPSGPRLIEVNGRLGGFIHLLASRASGLNLIALAGRIALALECAAPRADLDRVCYERTHLAPAFATQVLNVDGVKSVRQLPFVQAYRVLVPAGGQLVQDQSTQPLDLLSGNAVTHEEMLADIRQAQDLLTFTFADQDGAPRAIRGEAIDKEGDLAVAPGQLLLNADSRCAQQDGEVTP